MIVKILTYLMVIMTSTLFAQGVDIMTPKKPKKPKFLTVNLVEAAEITLVWDANSEPDLEGYKIHYGLASGIYSTIIDVSLTLTPQSPEHKIIDLSSGVRYYFAATAYDLDGNESNFSDEVDGVPTDVGTPPIPGDIKDVYLQQKK